MKVSLKAYAEIHGIKHGTVRSYAARGLLTVIDRDGRYTYVDSDEVITPRVSYVSKYGKQPRLSGILRSMRARCYNPKNTHYKYYGGKGVSICDEWLHNTYNFVEWALANGYSDDLTIDRIDPNGNYCPENCRWISLKENSRRAATDEAGRRNMIISAYIRSARKKGMNDLCEKLESMRR